MKLSANLPIHAHDSRATRKDLTIPHLAVWARRKGVPIVGTGDMAYPGWPQELGEALEPAEEGLFRRKEEVARGVARDAPPHVSGHLRFMLVGENNTINRYPSGKDANLTPSGSWAERSCRELGLTYHKGMFCA